MPHKATSCTCALSALAPRSAALAVFRYQPRMTTLDPDATVPSGYDNRFLTIPKTILDALEERPEWDMPMVDAASVDTGVTPFVRQTPQRIMVTHEDSTQEPSSPARRDILPVEAQVSLFNEAGVLRLRATVTRERLAGLSDMKRNGKTLDHHLLRFRFDTDATGDGAPDSIHSGDLEEMERRAQSPKGALVWFGPPGGQAEAGSTRIAFHPPRRRSARFRRFGQQEWRTPQIQAARRRLSRGGTRGHQ